MPQKIKGDPIRVVGGKYAGRKGWKHAVKGETDSQIYLILQAVVEDNVEIYPEKVVRIDKKHYLPFVVATVPTLKAMEQKPRLQQKMIELIKELVKLDMEPSEEFLVIFGYQWLATWEKQKEAGWDRFYSSGISTVGGGGG